MSLGYLAFFGSLVYDGFLGSVGSLIALGFLVMDGSHLHLSRAGHRDYRARLGALIVSDRVQLPDEPIIRPCNSVQPVRHQLHQVVQVRPPASLEMELAPQDDVLVEWPP
jgi:hypothetical protein